MTEDARYPTTTEQRVDDLAAFIDYLEATREDEWCVDVVRTKDKKQNCVFGHLVNWVWGPGYLGNVTQAWDQFEAQWATTYMLYPVNDGEHPDYQQKTPKRRVVAYLTDLLHGDTPSTPKLMEEVG